MHFNESYNNTYWYKRTDSEMKRTKLEMKKLEAMKCF